MQKNNNVRGNNSAFYLDTCCLSQHFPIRNLSLEEQTFVSFSPLRCLRLFSLGSLRLFPLFLFGLRLFNTLRRCEIIKYRVYLRHISRRYELTQWIYKDIGYIKKLQRNARTHVSVAMDAKRVSRSFVEE